MTAVALFAVAALAPERHLVADLLRPDAAAPPRLSAIRTLVLLLTLLADEVRRRNVARARGRILPVADIHPVQIGTVTRWVMAAMSPWRFLPPQQDQEWSKER